MLSCISSIPNQNCFYCSNSSLHVWNTIWSYCLGHLFLLVCFFFVLIFMTFECIFTLFKNWSELIMRWSLIYKRVPLLMSPEPGKSFLLSNSMTVWTRIAQKLTIAGGSNLYYVWILPWLRLQVSVQNSSKESVVFLNKIK